jgi:uncharacterized surface protein with fasciclin (FAS1) repeats
MKLRTRVAAVAAAAALGVSGIALTAPAAQAQGQRSLAAVLTANGGGTFDQNAKDYDIVTQAVLAVLAAKPNSKVKVLTDGTVPLTAFIPNDQAFRLLVKDLTGIAPRSEKQIFNAVAKLGIPTVEAVLLYHVVPGATIYSSAAVKANGAVLKTAQGGTLAVAVYAGPEISLWDKDRNSRNARVILSQVDINKYNKQVAHGIDRVLRPIDLPPVAHS